ncbi:winged helix-turn-helix transcriptional regulator [Agrococcus sediminis]|uniref:Winged helix-turn-helix transcriptional regulator n=1 Tax=Agrococcus sediminis TaxID=2599924 RepID=A0A5M8QP27_9MICO|nr:metalloregulator ArsR/SmtB family transcription factor [Agrococcus sediminis]KAA6436476.1 winged helix-turn-helix transcriptional regulator [Agrococcus sediminis]RWR24827.1 ArsR family transcriptional regulator [Agrococcus lahaulensis]
MADIFSVIADSTRRDILGVLLERRAATGEASVSQIVDALGVPQPTVSKHLRTLRDAGLVTVREDGQHRHYAIVLAPFDEIDDWLMPFIFAEGEQDEASLGAAAFAAWAGVQVPAPLRAAADQARLAAEQARVAAEQALARMSDRVEHPAPVGASLGRRAAEGMHDLQDRVQEARDRIHEVQDRLHEMQSRASQRLDDAKGKLRKREEEDERRAALGEDGHAAREQDDSRLD